MAHVRWVAFLATVVFLTLAGGCRTDTVYEVFIPAGYYSTDGG